MVFNIISHQGVQVKATMHYFFLKMYLFIWWRWSLLWHVGSFSCGMRDLVPRLGIEPGTPALGAWNLNHWTTSEVPTMQYYCTSTSKAKIKRTNSSGGLPWA